jgi:hypothetical protein
LGRAGTEIGLYGMAEPDWDTLAVADEDVDTSRRFARFLASRVGNVTIGRELTRATGFAAEAVTAASRASSIIAAVAAARPLWPARRVVCGVSRGRDVTKVVSSPSDV